MEKSQWDLKRIRFQRRRLTRLDDFVQTYQNMHDALIIEYQDGERTRKKVRSIFCFCNCARSYISFNSLIFITCVHIICPLVFSSGNGAVEEEKSGA